MITKITKKDIIKNPKLLLNKFFYYKGIDINKKMFYIIYYFYKFDGKLLYCYLKHYHHNGNHYNNNYIRIEFSYNKTSFEATEIF